MVQGKVEICGVNTAKLPLLKAADKDALFAKIREGDTAARESYIEGNLRLVLSVIKRFSGKRTVHQRKSQTGVKRDQEIFRKQ